MINLTKAKAISFMSMINDKNKQWKQKNPPTVK
jgi:hypothetical protein